MKRKPRFCAAIIGGGRVGSVLGRLLTERGEEVSCIVSRTMASARKAGRFVGCRNTGISLAAIPAPVNLVIIATPHEAIGEVTGNLARLPHLRWRSLAVCHTSGMNTALALAPAEQKGALTFSFHPLQTFPRDFPPREIVDRVPGIYYGVDGSAKGIARAKALARRLGGKVIEVPPELRGFYHAACVVASNHLTTLLWVLEQMSVSLGLRKKEFLRVFQPIIDATLHNAGITSPAQALSGPVARGGVETIAGHFEAIRRVNPTLMPYFLQMTEETARLAAAKGSLTDERAAALASLIASYRAARYHQQEIH